MKMHALCTPPINEMVYTALTLRELMVLREDMMSIESDKLIEPHLGKWLKVEGKIADIYSLSSDGISVITRYYGGKAYATSVFLDFSAQWRERLETMPKGTYIVAHGKIDKINYGEIALRECLVESYGRTL